MTIHIPLESPSFISSPHRPISRHFFPPRSMDGEFDALATQSSTSAPTCSICFERASAFAGPHQLACLACGHAFGYSCALDWIVRASSCPVCDEPSAIEDVRRLFLHAYADDGEGERTRASGGTTTNESATTAFERERAHRRALRDELRALRRVMNAKEMKEANAMRTTSGTNAESGMVASTTVAKRAAEAFAGGDSNAAKRVAGRATGTMLDFAVPKQRVEGEFSKVADTCWKGITNEAQYTRASGALVTALVGDGRAFLELSVAFGDGKHIAVLCKRGIARGTEVELLRMVLRYWRKRRKPTDDDDWDWNRKIDVNTYGYPLLLVPRRAQSRKTNELVAICQADQVALYDVTRSASTTRFCISATGLHEEWIIMSASWSQTEDNLLYVFVRNNDEKSEQYHPEYFHAEQFCVLVYDVHKGTAAPRWTYSYKAKNYVYFSHMDFLPLVDSNDASVMHAFTCGKDMDFATKSHNCSVSGDRIYRTHANSAFVVTEKYGLGHYEKDVQVLRMTKNAGEFTAAATFTVDYDFLLKDLYDKYASNRAMTCVAITPTGTEVVIFVCCSNGRYHIDIREMATGTSIQTFKLPGVATDVGVLNSSSGLLLSVLCHDKLHPFHKTQVLYKWS